MTWNLNIRIQPFVFSEIVEGAIRTHNLIAANKNIDLTCTGCDNIIWIKADVSMIEIALQNLDDNALKNTLEKGVVNIFVATDKSKVVLK